MERPANKPPHDPVERAQERGDEPLDAAMRAADALFSRHVPEDVEHEPSSEASDGFSDGSTGGAKPPGRILRALDEAPAPEVTAIETERAPKRRGRKPGSKNKPKDRPADLFEGDDDDRIEIGHATGGLAQDVFSKSRVAKRPADASGGSIPRVPALPPALLANMKVGVPAGRTEASDVSRHVTRATWKRDRLKPWEGWKRRRLPRVCW